MYTAIVQVLSMQSWKVAEQTLDQALAIHLSAEAASRSKVCVKQLYLLFGMHDHLSPAMAYAKLEKTLSEIFTGVCVGRGGVSLTVYKSGRKILPPSNIADSISS